jgi:serine/threonine protein kinase
MEYVEGVTLRDRLRKPIPMKEAIHIARQMAEALAVAHRAGIVHHDIKPANIMLRGDGVAKVLDFGLARKQAPQAVAAAAGDADQTLTGATATATGGFSGTPGYAAPEQLQLAQTDARTDLFALGAVIYEMLAGKPPFHGKNVYELCNAVLSETPTPVETIRRDTPPMMARVVGRCLEKDRARRYQCAADVALDLESSHQQSPEPRGARLRPSWYVLAAVAIGAFALGASLLFLRKSEKRGYWKLPASPPKQLLRRAGYVTDAALSPDGKQFVYVWRPNADPKDWNLYFQSLSGGDAHQLTNDGVVKQSPRFSPDGNRVIYTRGSSLYTIDLPAGLPRVLLNDATLGEWSPDGRQLAFIRPSNHQVMIADADGQNSRAVASPPRPPSPRGVSWSPDGKTLALVDTSDGTLYTARAMGGGGPAKQVAGLTNVQSAIFTPDGQFFLTIIGLGYNASVYQVSLPGGEAIPFAVGTSTIPSMISLSRDGQKFLATLFRFQVRIMSVEPGPDMAENKFRQVVSGDGPAMALALSPDEKQISYIVLHGSTTDIWIAESDGSNARQLTTDVYRAGSPAWAPDAKTIAFLGLGRPGPASPIDMQLWTVRLDEGAPRPLTAIDGEKDYISYAADGKHLFFEEKKGDKRNIWWAPLDGATAPAALTTDGVSRMPRAAPLGASVAFVRESSPTRYEICILDSVTGQSRVAVASDVLAKLGFDGGQLRYSHDGKELFFNSRDGLFEVGVNGGVPKKFSFPFPASGSFEVFADRRKIIFQKMWNPRTSEPWLYDDLR